MKKINLLILSTLVISTTVYAQNRPFESVNGSIRVTENINQQAPHILLPPGVKMYGTDIGREENINIQTGGNPVNVEVIDDVGDIDDINAIQGGVIPIPQFQEAMTINQPLQVPNIPNQNVNNTSYIPEVRKTVGQVSIEPVIIPSSISQYNRTTLNEFTEIGKKRLEESYREFLMNQ